MKVPFNIKEFLHSVDDISFGYQSIDFVTAQELENSKIDRSIEVFNSSLERAQIINWPSEWVVIAYDNLGDPICVDIESTNNVVLSVPPTGTGGPTVIADTLSNFSQILFQLKKLSKHRSDPESLTSNPVSAIERQAFLNSIADKNPVTDITFWSDFLDNA